MRRRPRIDLGLPGKEQEQQSTSTTTRDEEIRERKRKRWAAVNKNRPAEENPFLAAIKPDHDNYGDVSESSEELRARLESLEFGNYPGYFNYRNKAATTTSKSETVSTSCVVKDSEPHSTSEGESSLKDGLADERLKLMKKEWFSDKNVLDIGCNRGHVTYAIAKLFSPKFILGIDIDLKMINMANRDLHHHLESDIIKDNIDYRIKRAVELTTTMTTTSQDEAGDKGSETSNEQLLYSEDERQHHFPLSSYVSRGPLAVPLAASSSQSHTSTRVTNCDINNGTKDTGGDGEEQTNKRAEDVPEEESLAESVEPKLCQRQATFPNNILFVEHNYVLSRDELVDKQKSHFDTIICLSVTKWIHLNYRDDGLKRFFRRIYKHLRADGGLFVLEAQPFDNYHRKKKLSERLRANFNSIKFKPEQFDDFLLSDQVGFRQIIFSTTTEHECLGFKRPMKVFLK